MVNAPVAPASPTSVISQGWGYLLEWEPLHVMREVMDARAYRVEREKALKAIMVATSLI